MLTKLGRRIDEHREGFKKELENEKEPELKNAINEIKKKKTRRTLRAD